MASDGYALRTMAAHFCIAGSIHTEYADDTGDEAITLSKGKGFPALAECHVGLECGHVRGDPGGLVTGSHC